MFKKYQPNFHNNRFNSGKDIGRFKVRGPIKSFRDLDVYNKSTELSAEIFTLQASEESGLSEELSLLKNLSKHIPKMIAESYGHRFDRFSLAERKLEKTAEVVTAVISKIDFILSVLKKEQGQILIKENKKENAVDFKQTIENLLRDYTAVRAKILNLKRAWIRINENFNKSK